MHRLLPIPAQAGAFDAEFTDDRVLKAHPAYRLAKAGDRLAAARLVRDLAIPWIERAKVKYPAGCVYVAPHALEATGENAIPQTLAAALSVACQGYLDDRVLQGEKVFHTGADPMERLIARPTFVGGVKSGARYVLVDDVSTMGGTVAELANYIQWNGGVVFGVSVLVNASRAGTLIPNKRQVKILQERYGDKIQAIFGIAPEALTADEAGYLVGFRTVDEIRTRATKARQETDRRLRAKGIRRPGTFQQSLIPLFRFFRGKGRTE